MRKKIDKNDFKMDLKFFLENSFRSRAYCQGITVVPDIINYHRI